MIMLARRNTTLMNFHLLLADIGSAVGIAGGTATLLRIDEIVIGFRSRAWLVGQLLQERAGKKEALARLTDQHAVQLSLEDTIRGFKLSIDALEHEMGESKTDRAELRANLAKLQPSFDGAIVYIHCLTAWGLRLLRALKANNIHLGIDENLPKPPDVLLEYVPDEHRPQE